MNKWSFRRIFSSTPDRPPAPLLDQSVIDRDEVHKGRIYMASAVHGAIGSHSPISTLPAELVQRIFLTYLETYNRTSTIRNPIKYSHGRLQAPFLLSSVCRRWRAHALESALLWTYIVVPALVYTPSTPSRLITRRIKRDMKQLQKRWLGLIQLLLVRSGQAGLHIIIPKLHYFIVQPSLAFHRSALLSLAPDRARIQTLCMSLEGPTALQIWRIIGTCHVAADGTQILDAPRLEHLNIESWKGWIQGLNVHLEAPLLRTFVIHGTTCLLPQLSSLVRFEVTLGTLTPWTQTLSFCATTLESLHLHIVPFRNSEDRSTVAHPLSKIIFPRLTHFGITTDDCPSDNLLHSIFATISAPKLRSAYFSAPCDDPPTAPAFVQFINYLGNHENGAVEELAFAYGTEYQGLDISDARSIFRHLPSIEIITLVSSSCIAVGFIEAIHHFAPHVQIHIEHATVWLPTSSPQQQLTVAVETMEHGDGTTSERRLAFFDVTQATHDYDTINRTGNILPDYRCSIQTVVDVVVVWTDGPGIGSKRGKEQVHGPRYQILPRQLYEMPDPHENDIYNPYD